MDSKMVPNESITKNYLGELENKVVFLDEDILIFDNLKDFNLRGKIQVDNYILSLCINGHGTLALNNKQYNMGKNDIFICRPKHILEALMMSIDFECICICLTKEYMQNILLQSSGSWNMRIYIENNPVLHVNDVDAKLIIQYTQLIKTTISQSNKHHYKEIFTALMYALSLDFSNMLEKVTTTESPQFSSAEKTFNEFFDLLTSTFSRHRPISYYADKLCITSKYLSVICKKVSNKTALELVAEYSIQEIKTRLKMRHKTIKGIASELGFDNVSYFSKYFKHYTGISPKQYREKFQTEKKSKTTQ